MAQGIQYELNLRDYWRILKKRKMIIIFTMFMLGFTSYGFALLQKPIPLYTATSSIKVEKNTNLSGLYLATVAFNQGNDLETHAAIIISYPIMEKVAKKIGAIPEGLTSDEVRSNTAYLWAVNRLKGMVSTRLEGFTNIINIFVTSTDPKEARGVANAVAEVYREENSYENNKRTYEAKKFIEDQLKSVGTRLREAELRVIEFREREKIVSQTTKVTANFSELTELKNLEKDQEKLTSTIGQVETVKFRLQSSLQKEGADGQSSEAFYLADAPSLYSSLNTRLSDLAIKRENLLKFYTELHPEVRDLQANIADAMRGMLGQLLIHEKNLKEREKVVREEYEAIKDRYTSLRQVGSELERLERQVQLTQQIYSQLESKYQEVLIREAEKIEEISIVRPALEPGSPINPPNTTGTTFVGTVIGLILGLVFAIISETLDTSIGTIEDVENYLNVSVIGLIPYIDLEQIKESLLKDGIERDREALERNAKLISHFDPKSTLAESYRALRTNIQFLCVEKSMKVLAVTSSLAQEGKTTTIVNLALTMAQVGMKTLLIDADLRKPTVWKVFGLEREPGLTDVILGNYEWKETIRTVTDIMMGKMGMEDIMLTPGIDNLNIITCGTIPPNPAELLNSKRVDEFITKVKDDYDIVLFDSPPVLPATDAVILGRKVDGVVLVYEVGQIARGSLKRSKLQLDHVNANVLGVVLNGLKAEISPDYQDLRYDYYYSYGGTERKRIRQKSLKSRLNPASWFSKTDKERV